MPRKRQHVVSASYQRAWAAGKQIELIWKADLSSKRVGIRDAFVAAGFNSVQTPEGVRDELENEWARLENMCVPVVRALADREVAAHEPEVEVAAKAMIAMHWARSYAVRSLADDHYDRDQREAIAAWPDENRLQEAFEQDHGRAAGPNEIAELVEAAFLERRRSNRYFVEHMVSLHNKAVDHFQPLKLEVGYVVPGPHELLIGDSPVVLADGLRVGARNGVALAEAEWVYLPIGPKACVSLTTTPTQTLDVYPLAVQQLNSFMWRNCDTHLAARPDSDWNRSLAKRRRPLPPGVTAGFRNDAPSLHRG